MGAANAGGLNIGGFIIPIAFLAIFYMFAIRPQRKRDKNIREMRENLKVGDEIVSIGGIFGKIVKIKDDMITLEVGANKTKLDLTKWAVGSVINKQDIKENDENK